jgi:hypothetical protein
VLILIPCGNVTADTRLPPSCPGFDPAAQMKQAYALGLNVIVRLEPQYSAYGSTCFGGPGGWVLPDPTERWAGHLRATHDTGSNYTRYTSVATSYAKVAASLPRPPHGGKLAVQIGNELNLAWGCDCTADNVCMPMARVAAEVAFFSRDAVAALQAVPGLSVALTPIAPIGYAARSCCHNTSECHRVAANVSDCDCPGSASVTLTSLEFGKLLLLAVPTLYDTVDWFSSHAYPCAPPGCGLNGDPRPGTNGWNAPFEVALPWLVVYRNETREAGRPTLPVIVTETGWCGDFCTEADRAEWTAAAWRVWVADPQIVAVCPFLLEGRQWWPKGFPWIAADGATRLPVFNATVALRCQLFPATC